MQESRDTERKKLQAQFCSAHSLAKRQSDGTLISNRMMTWGSPGGEQFYISNQKMLGGDSGKPSGVQDGIL